MMNYWKIVPRFLLLKRKYQFHTCGKFGSSHTPCLSQLAVDVLCTCSSSRHSQAAGLQRSASWSAAPWCPPPPCKAQKKEKTQKESFGPVLHKATLKWPLMFLHPHKHLNMNVNHLFFSFTCWPFEAFSQAWCRYHSDRHQSWESAPGSDWQGAGWVSPLCRGRDAAEAETERSVREGLGRGRDGKEREREREAWEREGTVNVRRVR